MKDKEITVAEFIEWLSLQDQGAIVQVVKGETFYRGYGSTDSYSFKNFSLDLCSYTDFRGNKFVKKDSAHYNKRYLELGELV